MENRLPFAQIDKREVVEALRQRLADDLASLASSQDAAQRGATHEETRPEHPKDTRAIEATYLARGLAERSESLRQALERLAGWAPPAYGPDDAVAIGALVRLEEAGGAESVCFLVPVGGGEKLEVAGVRVQTLTAASPLGSRLMGRETDDEIAFERPSGAFEAVVAELR